MQTTQEVPGAAQAIPRWIDLAHGIRVFVRPMTAELEADARQFANTKVREALRAPSVIAVMGGEAALANVIFAQSLAVEAIERWEGVVDPVGRPALISQERVEDLMMVEGMAESFIAAYCPERPRAA